MRQICSRVVTGAGFVALVLEVMACTGSYRGNDSGVDGSSGGDGSSLDDSGDGGGCGPTDTPSNCGACGNVCNTTTSAGNATCNGTTCLYDTCNPGRSDCNRATAPNLDGCECATPSCCGMACAVTHDNGVGNAFYDCAPLNTFNQTEATAACVAWTKNTGLCMITNCNVDGGFAGEATFAFYMGKCISWGYSGPMAGHLYQVNPASSISDCRCPDQNQPLWH